MLDNGSAGSETNGDLATAFGGTLWAGSVTTFAAVEGSEDDLGVAMAALATE